MRCEVAHERIVTAAYGELSGDQMHELERHLAGCAECPGEREQLLALKLLAEAHPVLEPDANLVARARMKLDEKLDSLPRRRWHESLNRRVRGSFAGLLAAPLAATLLLIAGAVAGTIGGYQFERNRALHAAEARQDAAPQTQEFPRQHALPAPQQSHSSPTGVANVSSIVRQPNSDFVEVRYNQLLPQRLVGSVHDPAIQRLLMLASKNSASAGVRDGSVGLLAAECRAGRGCRQTGIRDALMVALRYDSDARIREKALHGLEPYVAEDMQVRNAVLEALMNDDEPRIRTAAINILEPVEADTSVRQVLYSVSNSDQNPYIRTVSRQVLSRVPEIQ